MRDSAGGSAFTVEVLTDVHGLDRVAARWRFLLSVTPHASGFQSLGWVRACWETLSGAVDQLFVTVVRHHGDVIAIFPTKRSKGTLSFIGGGVSNYSGPVYDPEHADQVVDAWVTYIDTATDIVSIDLSGLREGTPLFAGLKSALIPRWGRPLVSEINICPEADLTCGWDALVGRHKSKQRGGWKRKERRLSSLGTYEFVETDDPDEIAAAMPRIFSLFHDRWAGQRISGGFVPALGPFHAATVRHSGEERYLRLSMLKLDGEIIAFSYGVRAANVTSSYLLAHDSRFNLYSVGLLLVIRILEAACLRGDPMYDFSLGSAEYKALWATGERRVYRLFWGRGSRLRFLSSEAWVRARSVGWMRHLKRHGLRALGPAREVAAPDSPGLPSGPSGRWFVYRVAGGSRSPSRLSRRRYGYMSDHLSPRLLELAIERSFRGDELLAAEDGSGLVGVVWRAAESRRSTVTGNADTVAGDEVVYYHPAVRTGESLEDFVLEVAAGEGSCVVVTCTALRNVPNVSYCLEFAADFSFSEEDGIGRQGRVMQLYHRLNSRREAR